ncbi:MAG: NlpC/P60 family protein [Candidatus Eremiobacterota bacterium]
MNFLSKKIEKTLFVMAVMAILLSTGSYALAGSYVVKSGDSLSAIANSIGLTSEELAAANGISRDKVLMPGDVIYIPSGGSSGGGGSYYVINASDVNLRSGPSCQDAVLCGLNKGEKIKIIEDRGQWCYVRLSDGYEGWVTGDYIGYASSSSSSPSSSSSSYTPQKYITKSYVCSDSVNVRKKPSFNADILFSASINQTVYVLNWRGDWIYVAFNDGTKAWMYYDYIACYHGQPSLEKKETKTAKKTTQVASNTAKSSGSTSQNTKNAIYYSNQNNHYTTLSSRGSGLSASIVQLAYSFLGTPYVWGGTTPRGFDCSGFVQTIFALNGIKLLRMADEQFTQGNPVAREDLRIGDLVFFTTYTSGASHVGIYIGDSSFIHASSSGGCVKISSLEEDYYSARFLGGRRFF